jgi:hypothetical protein
MNGAIKLVEQLVDYLHWERNTSVQIHIARALITFLLYGTCEATEVFLNVFGTKLPSSIENHTYIAFGIGIVPATESQRLVYVRAVGTVIHKLGASAKDIFPSDHMGLDNFLEYIPSNESVTNSRVWKIAVRMKSTGAYNLLNFKDLHFYCILLLYWLVLNRVTENLDPVDCCGLVIALKGTDLQQYITEHVRSKSP